MPSKKLDALKDIGLGLAAMALSPGSGLASMELQAARDFDQGKKGSGSTLLAEDARRFAKTTSDEFSAGLAGAKRGVAKLLEKDDEPEKKARGGKVSSASKRADGIAQRGKTKGRMV
jgi:hypothetical protein